MTVHRTYRNGPVRAERKIVCRRNALTNFVSFFTKKIMIWKENDIRKSCLLSEQPFDTLKKLELFSFFRKKGLLLKENDFRKSRLPSEQL